MWGDGVWFLANDVMVGIPINFRPNCESVSEIQIKEYTQKCKGITTIWYPSQQEREFGGDIRCDGFVEEE